MTQWPDETMKRFYLTTPLYYPNARPHVGSAYTTIVCDVIARYKRMCGYDVAFLTGTDEHGEKLERAAIAAGISPSEFVAEKRQLFVDLWKKLGIEYSHFVYTDQPDHVTSVQRMLLRARAQRLHRQAPLRGPLLRLRRALYLRRHRAGELRHLRPAGGTDQRRKLLLQAFGLSGPLARTLREASRVRAARLSAATK